MGMLGEHKKEDYAPEEDVSGPKTISKWRKVRSALSQDAIDESAASSGRSSPSRGLSPKQNMPKLNLSALQGSSSSSSSRQFADPKGKAKARWGNVHFFIKFQFSNE